jgi:hypothetical protein
MYTLTAKKLPNIKCKKVNQINVLGHASTPYPFRDQAQERNNDEKQRMISIIPNTTHMSCYRPVLKAATYKPETSIFLMTCFYSPT